MPANDVALVVGLDHYSTKPLASCVNDATRIQELLKRNGDAQQTTNYSVDLLVSQAGKPLPSRPSFLQKVHETLHAARDHDFVFYFSGHGATHPWGTELIVNDDPTERVGLEELLALFNAQGPRQVVVILDACFSGAFGQVPALGGGREFVVPSVLRPSLMLLAAARADEVALAGTRYSAFTELLIAGLEGGAADHTGAISASSLFGYAEPAFGPLDQRPTFKANLSVSHALRTCEPSVPLTVLRRLKDHFPPGSDAITLAPSDVPNGNGSSRTGAQRRFSDLLKLRETGLVRCPDDRHLADHAADGNDIRLTPAGSRLRGLAVRGKI